MEYQQDGTCRQENAQRGKLGPVLGEERLVRIVRSPQHIGKNQKLRPGLFSLTDISAKGVSLTRIDHVEKTEFLTYAHAVAELKDGEKLHGFRSALASQIRGILTSDNLRALCVLEEPAQGIAGVPDNPAHAVAISAVKIVEQDKIIEIQLELVKIFAELAF